ncbi:MAG: SDR family NAD(P)-dependent oxidoreductase [Halieaceae bacterium]
MSFFAGKIAVITGAGSGIGRGLAVALNRAGCVLELSDINTEALVETRAALERKELAFHLEQVDVADRSAMEQWAAAVGERRQRVDIVVNNAGVALGGNAEDNSIEDIEWLMGINFWGVVYGCKAFLPWLRKSPAAHLVNISSVFGIIAVPTQSAYNAAKFAVRGYTEALRQELADSSIHVCCVHPGGVQTNIARAARTDHDAEQAAEFADRFEEMAKTSPDSAAEQIMNAMLRRKKRLLIGHDAKLITLISRLFPVSYPRVLGWFSGTDVKSIVEGKEHAPGKEPGVQQQ